jgi:hypothetical protein
MWRFDSAELPPIEQGGENGSASPPSTLSTRITNTSILLLLDERMIPKKIFVLLVLLVLLVGLLVALPALELHD